MDKLIELAEKYSRWMAWVGGSMVLASALLIAAEVFLRKVLNISIGGADELSGYALGVSVTWAMSFTLMHRANIRIDALYHSLPPRLCALLDILSLAALGAFVGLITTYAATVVSDTYTYSSTANTPLQTPLIIPQGLWLFGFIVFLLILSLLLLRGCIALIRGDLSTINKICGVRTVEEDIDEEVSDDIRELINNRS